MYSIIIRNLATCVSYPGDMIAGIKIENGSCDPDQTPS